MKLWPGGPAREPDIIFVRSENRSQLTSRRFKGAPDLIVEVVSPGSVTEDRVHKFREYEQAGVHEYWIIDPRRHQQQADFYILDADGVFHSAPLDDQGIYHSMVIPHFWLDISWLWQEQLPNPQAALAKIMLSIEELADDVRSAYQTLYNSLTGRS